MRNSTQQHQQQQHHDKAMASMKYTTFAMMIAAGSIIMFGLMYLNTYALDHIFFSETRAYMTVIMGATMAVVMLLFMWKMYPNKVANFSILVGSVITIFAALWLVRSQVTVDDVSYMRAMIPHHSIAILTSERAKITDPRVRKLADDIIAAQRKEIGEMKRYIEDLEAKR
ncbi:MAG: DUF305 domain-containing protein [Polaromonas sp.]|jgi:hypothetical protein|uniref:DUF305 domain-containing protein n=1 Tax=Polaromonas sp. TaxID=1869339 RepID=UPI00248A1C61|nr:DUF305 domain-containing protein [Polaromonas sp.]MDI1267714.1 DUF305 domain-containing protein [Polaromonas sp.]